MSFKLRGTSAQHVTKMYLYPTTDAAAPASRHFEYVTADPAGTADGSGYISSATEDGRLALDMLHVGDLIWVFQVGSIDDTRPIEADKAAGVTSLSLHMVLANTGSVIDLSDDLLGLGSLVTRHLTYGD